MNATTRDVAPLRHDRLYILQNYTPYFFSHLHLSQDFISSWSQGCSDIYNPRPWLTYKLNTYITASQANYLVKKEKLLIITSTYSMKKKVTLETFLLLLLQNKRSLQGQNKLLLVNRLHIFLNLSKNPNMQWIHMIYTWQGWKILPLTLHIIWTHANIN